MRGNRKIYILGIGIISFLVQGLGAQYIEVKTELDTNQIRIGEAIHLNIHLHQPEGVRVDFPPIKDTLVENLEVTDTWPADTTLVNGDMEILKRYRLTSFDSGLYVVPPLKFRFSSDLWTDSLESNPMYIYVHTVPVDSTIYDVKYPMHMPLGFMEVLPYILGGLILIPALGLLWWYLRRRKNNKPLFGSPKPEDPAHIIAFRELRELGDEKLWQKNEFKKYYTRLTEIVRRYLDRRYGIRAMELTSHEIMEEWKLSAEDKDDLAEKLYLLLNLADLVKFAKQKPYANENEENMDRAYDFIEKTKWEAPETEEE